MGGSFKREVPDREMGIDRMIVGTSAGEGGGVEKKQRHGSEEELQEQKQT